MQNSYCVRCVRDWDNCVGGMRFKLLFFLLKRPCEITSDSGRCIVIIHTFMLYSIVGILILSSTIRMDYGHVYYFLFALYMRDNTVKMPRHITLILGFISLTDNLTSYLLLLRCLVSIIIIDHIFLLKTSQVTLWSILKCMGPTNTEELNWESRQ